MLAEKQERRGMDRRRTLGLGLAGALAGTMLAGRAAADTVMPGDGSIPSDPREVIALWPGIPPGGADVHLAPIMVDRAPPGAAPDRLTWQIGTPSLTVFRAARPNGAGIILAPGGGYWREILDKEAYETARRLAEAGFTAFVLRSRLPGEGWPHRADVPLQDAQRAMRLVRAYAGHYGIDPARLGFMGFSAGGHLAASIATRFGAHVYDAVDGADGLSARPDFAALLYPVITMGEGAHIGSRNHLLGDTPSAADIDAYSAEKHIPGDAPPVFICLAANDPLVPAIPNGVAMFLALRAKNIPSELHVFEDGGHGFGLWGTPGKPDAIWPDLFLNWCRAHGVPG
jgi:acetyl esterase/lipase